MEKSIDTLNKSINTLEDFEFSKEVIKDAVSNYNSNIENLSFDEKRSLVRKLVNKITVVKEDWKNIRFRIYFKFGVKNWNWKPPSHELSNTDEQQKNTPKGDAFFLNGRLHNSSCILSNFF